MRVIALALLAALLTACGGGGSTKNSSGAPPAPLNIADPPVDTSSLIVFVGDSITASWPVRQYIPTAQNVGVSGEQTDQMLARFEADVLARNPKIVVILGGTNDIRNLARVDTSNLFAMVQKALAASVHVIVGTLPPADNLGPDPDLKRQLWPQFNKEVRDGAAALGYEVADYNSVLVQANGTIDQRYFTDGLHPNAYGYNAMWSVLRPLIELDIRR